MGLIRTRVKVTSIANGRRAFEADFLVEIDCLMPAAELRRIGARVEGTRLYRGTERELPYGIARFACMGRSTGKDVIFGLDDAEPILGATALESLGITIDPASQTLKSLPAISLK